MVCPDMMPDGQDTDTRKKSKRKNGFYILMHHQNLVAKDLQYVPRSGKWKAEWSL